MIRTSPCVMVSLTNTIQVKLYWRSGVIFECPTAQVMLTVDKKRNILKLIVRGQQQVIKLVELDEIMETLLREWTDVRVFA